MTSTEVKKQNICFISPVVVVWLDSNTLVEELCHWNVKK
jgi:hypothetical protein